MIFYFLKRKPYLDLGWENIGLWNLYKYFCVPKVPDPIGSGYFELEGPN